MTADGDRSELTNFIVVFDVRDHSRRAALEAAIKELGEWGIVTPTTYLVATHLCPATTMERLHPMVAPDETLCVFAVSQPWAGYLDPIVEDLAAAQIGAEENWVLWDWDPATQDRPKSSE